MQPALTPARNAHPSNRACLVRCLPPLAPRVLVRTLLRNLDTCREQRRLLGEERTEGLAARAVDWQAEAAKVAASEPFEYGREGQDATVYMATSNGIWLRATEEERLAVIEAFATNTAVSSVEMVNSLVNDRLGEAWGRALAANTCITSLNLESNSISSKGIEAIAAGVEANSSLVQLKLANQHVACSQQAEEKLGEAVGGNSSLTRITIDLRSTRARDLINSAMQRNRIRSKLARGSSASAASAASTALNSRVSEDV